jgi:AraC-like DNA-binding protein
MDRYIESHLLDAVTPAELAAAHGVSVRTVNRIFNATEQTVGEVLRVRRLARARKELSAGDDAVSSIAHRWGFADASHFSRSFKAQYGISPSDYRNAVHLDRSVGASEPGRVAQVHVGARRARETGVTAAQG